MATILTSVTTSSLPVLAFLKNLFIYLATPCSMWDLSSLTRHQTCAPLHWEHGVFTAGPPGKPYVYCWILYKWKHIVYLLLFSRSVVSDCDPMDRSRPGFPVLHHLLEFAPTHVHLDIDAIQPSHPLSLLLLLPPIFPSIRVFSSGSELFIRWLKYWSSSFSISLSKEYSGLISFRID